MVLNGLHDSDEVQKKEEGQIIGSTIEGEMWVLDTKEHARTVIRMFGDLPDEKVNAMGLDELRSYVKAEIADYTGHIGSKVWYKQT
ncbi:hypothetical protein SAMN04487947_2517 [Halogeometricum rufum]|uniref:Uncharacterized protein n=2 Tax=Halogeometricum rufum TaxID=553469 RepID=A0A1I6HUJ7_9EURY|nr:hypothetical protein SAMN04487947_2517 [Halogeometricum rufum]